MPALAQSSTNQTRPMRFRIHWTDHRRRSGRHRWCLSAEFTQAGDCHTRWASTARIEHCSSPGAYRGGRYEPNERCKRRMPIAAQGVRRTETAPGSSGRPSTASRTGSPRFRTESRTPKQTTGSAPAAVTRPIAAPAALTHALRLAEHLHFTDGFAAGNVGQVAQHAAMLSAAATPLKKHSSSETS